MFEHTNNTGSRYVLELRIYLQHIAQTLRHKNLLSKKKESRKATETKEKPKQWRKSHLN